MRIYNAIILTVILFTNATFSQLFSDCWNGKCFRPQVPQVPRIQSIKQQPDTTNPLTIGITSRPSSSPTPVPNPYSSQCRDILTVLPLLSIIDKAQIKELCQNRFQQLHKQHKMYQILLRSKPVSIYGQDPMDTADPNSHLIVLDLDETIMDQASFMITEHEYSNSHVEYWQSLNSDELLVNVNQFERRHDVHRKEPRIRSFRSVRSYDYVKVQPVIWIGIFRKHFMKFIEFTQTRANTSYDIMLYSAAVSPLLIYQAVTMEIYYNYVYALQNTDIVNEFHFKYVVARPDDIRLAIRQKSKSLEILMNLFGSNGNILKKYTNIVIMDDMESNVWSTNIPQQMVDENMNLVCFAPFPFSYTGGGEKLPFTKHVLYITGMRNRDFIFTEMIRMLTDLDSYKNANIRHLVWNELDMFNVTSSDAE